MADLSVRGDEGVWLETMFGGVARVTLFPLVANGVVASSFDFPGAPAQVAALGRRIFIAAGDAGVRMVEDCDASFSGSCARDVATTPAIAVAAAPDGAVYFVDRGGELRRASPVRFELTTVVAAGRGAHGLRLFGNELYWARTDDRPGVTPEGGGSEIVRIGVDGTCPGARQCPQPVLRIAGGTIRALAVNQARVFATVTDVASERGRVLSALR